MYKNITKKIFIRDMELIKSYIKCALNDIEDEDMGAIADDLELSLDLLNNHV